MPYFTDYVKTYTDLPFLVTLREREDGWVPGRFLTATHLGTRTDVVAAPLMHDSPDELAQPGGQVRDSKHGQCDPVPG